MNNGTPTALRHRLGDQAVERHAALRRRHALHRRGRIAFSQRLDLVVKDQRQSGDAQHQQERRRHDAAPLVDQEPGLDRRAGHGERRSWEGVEEASA
ncbi:hypothetical protein LRS08_16930 [Sphingomonas sp. J315]|nr:hypothetical protein [Sphingomonas sp. J315]UUX99142.1 hypothetical protein LRS08_16930 [Sphingomonas sp. J315]